MKWQIVQNYLQMFVLSLQMQLIKNATQNMDTERVAWSIDGNRRQQHQVNVRIAYRGLTNEIICGYNIIKRRRPS